MAGVLEDIQDQLGAIDRKLQMLMEICVKNASTFAADALMTVEEAAAYTKLSETYLYKMIGRNTIPHQRVGRRVFVDRKELDQWMRQGTVRSRRQLDKAAEAYEAIASLGD